MKKIVVLYSNDWSNAPSLVFWLEVFWLCLDKWIWNTKMWELLGMCWMALTIMSGTELCSNDFFEILDELVFIV